MWSLCYEILAFEASMLPDLALQARVVQYIEKRVVEKEPPPTDENGILRRAMPAAGSSKARCACEQPSVTLIAM